MTNSSQPSKPDVASDGNKKTPSKPSIYCEVESIGPEKAAQYLRLNIETNRYLRVQMRNRYVTDMQSGNWYITDSIKFSEDGTLLDGQHRLSAVVTSGCTVDFLVCRGYPEDSVFGIDTGGGRTTSDIAKITGIDGASTNAIGAVNCLGYDLSTDPCRRKNFTKNEQIKLFLHFQEPLNAIKEMASDTGTGGSSKRISRNSAVLCTLMKAFEHENHLRLKEFIFVANTGFSEDVEAPRAAIVLRNYCIELGRRHNGQDGQIALMRLTQNAISKFCAKANPSFLRPVGGELFPVTSWEKILGYR